MKQFLLDDNGNLSHARLIAILVCFSATFFMWKMIVMGGMTETYFFYYLGYGVIHQNVNKALDVLGARFGQAASTQMTPEASETTKIS